MPPRPCPGQYSLKDKIPFPGIEVTLTCCICANLFHLKSLKNILIPLPSLMFFILTRYKALLKTMLLQRAIFLGRACTPGLQSSVGLSETFFFFCFFRRLSIEYLHRRLELPGLCSLISQYHLYQLRLFECVPHHADPCIYPEVWTEQSLCPCPGLPAVPSAEHSRIQPGAVQQLLGCFPNQVGQGYMLSFLKYEPVNEKYRLPYQNVAAIKPLHYIHPEDEP